jgi:hypothetical protein
LNGPTSIRVALLLHDGELRDLRPLLDTIGVATVEQLGSIPDADADADADAGRDWDLVIATPEKLVDLPPNLEARNRICVAERDSPMLQKLVKRVDVHIAIVRPMHREALKQVLIQALYAGPENRSSVRRAAGQSVRFKSGWRGERGILADLSVTGCRLLASQSLAPGSNLTVGVPLQADSRKALVLRGTVVRASLTDGAEEERHSIHVRFDKLADKVARSLSEIVEQLAVGPAGLSERNTGADAEAHATTASAAVRGSSPESLMPEASVDEPLDLEHVVIVDSGGDGKELRSDPRLVYSARIIAKGDGVARVLTAKDISLGGLSAESHPNAQPGDLLEVAIPLPGEKLPLIVEARVIRNDDGMALAFEKLPPGAYERFHRRLELLPEVESSFSEEDAPARVIVPEKK